MEAVGLIESRNPRNSREQERQQRQLLLSRDLCIHSAESPSVRNSIIRRRFHLNQNYLRLRLLLPHRRNQTLEVQARSIGRQTAQRIVCSSLDDDQIRRRAKNPVDSSQRTSCRLSRQAGVYHLDRNAILACFLLDQRRKCLLRIEAVTRSQTRSEEKNNRNAY